MYTDIQLSGDLSGGYLSGDPRKRKNPVFETEFFILSHSAWPVSKA